MLTGNKSLNKKTANDILQNVFEQCNVIPNSTPFDKLMLRAMAETKFVTILKNIALCLLLVLLCTPLAFKNDPNFSLIESSRHVTIENHALFDDFFVLTLAGKNIDYENIYAKKSDGAYIFPSTYDKSSGMVIFPYSGDALNIFIPAGNGDTIQAVLHENK